MMTRTRHTRRSRFAFLAIAMLLLVLTVTVDAGVAVADGAAINGGGSGFAALEMDQWRADTARAPFNLNVDYVAQGSSFGRNSFQSGNLDYGTSDIQYPDNEIPGLISSKRCAGRQPTQCFTYVPVSAGGLSFMYNLSNGSGQRVSNLALTRRAACGIFTGAISKWNDPQIVATNPALASVNRTIVPVIRSDGAGESYVLSEYCQAVASDLWKNFQTLINKVDAGQVAPDFAAGEPVSVWPGGWPNVNAVSSADGTANNVADPTTGPNSITYVAAGYAKVRNFPVASVQNAAGQYTQPDETNVTVALGYATGRANGTFALNFNGLDPRAYFPSTYSYVLAQTTNGDVNKGKTLGQFLCYAVSKGQEIAPSLRYARLSTVLVSLAINQISQIPGAPAKAACPVAGSSNAPPPITPNGGTAPPGSTPPGSGTTPNSGTTNTTPNGGVNPAGVTTGTTATGAPCTPAATVTTTTASSSATTTTKPAAATTTTAPKTSTTKASVTTTTVVCSPTAGSPGSDAATGNGVSAVGANGQPLDLQLASAATQHTPDSSDHTGAWMLLAGAGVCAVATTAFDLRRRATR
jgi:phosphate transport system substrate-binding protein